MSVDAPPTLDARDVRKTYRDGELETPVLHGVDLRLTSRSFTALTGQSGSGKSTLLSILGTLLRPSGGTVHIAGEDVTRLDDAGVTRFRNRALGFVFQFHHLLPDFTALENVLMPIYAGEGAVDRRDRARAQMLLERVGLRDRLRYRATRLSGGQKQRVAVARALMNRPRLVLADEPTGNLDRDHSHALMALLRDIAREQDTAFLISTHDPDIAARCDRTVHLADGRIVDAPRG
ncbi:MAG: ABC transporter ATP-binding protein [Acidobacteriota bacterium]